MSPFSLLPLVPPHACRLTIPYATLDVFEVSMMEEDPVFDEYFAMSGFIDPASSAPLPEDDDNFGPSLVRHLSADSDDDSVVAETVYSDYDDFDADDMECDISPGLTGIADDDLLAFAMGTVDPAVRALYALDYTLAQTRTSRSQYYQELRDEESLLAKSAPLRAHLDGGAMVSTTDRASALWNLRELSPEARPTLRVADDHKHRPTHQGYLKVQVDNAKGYEFVHCYFTPSLPATIISPDAASRQFNCRGYQSVSVRSNEPGSCSVTLNHCRRSSEDIVFPAGLIRGLLYTSPLIMPNRTERTAPLPVSVLHVRQVESCEIPTGDSSAPISPGTDVGLDNSSSCACASAATCPSSCSCSRELPRTAPDVKSDLISKILHYQRLGYQLDVSIEEMHAHADGIPAWDDSVPPVCGHCEPPADPAADPTMPSDSVGCSDNATSPLETGEGPSSSASDSPDSSAGEGVAFDAPMDSSKAPTNFEELLASENTYVLRHLTRDQLRLLWHQRLGHIHSRRVSKMHQAARGVPNVPVATELEKCPICLQAKLRKAARGTDDSRTATRCNQGISVDFGFLVQQSQDTERHRRLQGLNGETCYCLLVDHYSGTLYGETFRSKAPPIDFLNRWLAQHGLGTDVPGKYVRFDLGGELGRCTEIVDLFERAGYRVEPTAPASSHQNGPGERPHQTIGDGLRAMLKGAGLEPKFWPYAFHHFLRLYNLTIHRDHEKSPYEICTGLIPNLRYLRVFGCRVYAVPPRDHRPEKAVDDSRAGIFLGYARTSRNILYYDLESEVVKTAQHVVFDEAMHDAPVKPPNARMLDGLRNGGDPDALLIDDIFPELIVTTSPFIQETTVSMPLDAAADHPCGLHFDRCSRLLRAFVSRIDTPAAGHRIGAFRRKYVGSYVVSVNGSPVFSVADIDSALQRLQALEDPPSHVDFVFAPERRAEFDSRPTPLHLRLADLRHVCALQSVVGEGKTSAEFQSLIAEFEDDLTPTEMSELIHRLQTNDMTPEERRLKSFTRRNLQKLSNWSLWDEAFDTQLDAHFEAGTLGHPVPRPGSSVDGTPANVLRMQWSNLVKNDGTRKCRACVDGSKRAAPWLRQFAQTYASCIEQPCMRMFFALSAAKGFVVTIADTHNAFQQSPPPTQQCYLEIDDAYGSWYQKRFGKQLDRRNFVIPVNRALQGHPEAGALWERMIVDILCEKLDFKPTTHERNLYRGTIDGQLVLVCRQVDDFAIASQDRATTEKLVAAINSHVTTSSLGIGVRDDRGYTARYNGVDVHQTRNYIKLSCETYIDRLLQTHGWEKPGNRESDRFDQGPIRSDLAVSLQRVTGPAEGTKEHKKIESDVGFSYRQVLGELIYAYVICRLDIGYAVTLLARFAQAPAAEHYYALKQVCRYLRRTKDWGIVYHRSRPIDDLPDVPLPELPVDESLPTFPIHELLELVGYVDAAHATNLADRRSVTGMVFTLAGGAIAYKSKVQATVATSSTEGEFLAAVYAAKTAKYLRSVLQELGFEQKSPTVLYEDNQAAIAMINEKKPTPRSRHIDIQHFAIQEWRERKIVEMRYIATTINPADAATKALGWTLHARHVRRAMGHHVPA